MMTNDEILINILTELQNIRVILESKVIYTEQGRFVDGKLVKIPRDAEAQLKDLRKRYGIDP